MTDAFAPDPTGEVATEATGDAQVDAAIETLRRLDDLPVHDHADIVDGVHRSLQDRLAEGQE